MKLNRTLIAVSAMMIGVGTAYADAPSSKIKQSSTVFEQRSAPTIPTTHREHGIPKAFNKKSPQSKKNFEPNSSNSLFSKTAAAVACNVNAFATSNSTTLINQIKTQGSTCVNELFGAASNVQVTTFSSDNMYAVANHVAGLAVSYTGTGNADMEALYLFIRAGYYVEFYNNGVTFVSWVKPAVKSAIDAFVNNSHFYDNNDEHGKVLQEVITCMDSSEQQDVYLYVVREWLSRWNQSYGTSWNMRSAVNGIFTLMFRGQWNTNFVAAVGTDTTLVSRLRAFTLSQWMINSDSEFLIANAGREMGRLKTYSGTAIQTSVDSALNAIFSTYQMYGYGDAVWLGAADTATYYGNCADYNICGYGAQIEAAALSQTHTCSPTIKVRSQNLTAVQQSSICSTEGAEEVYFHEKMQSGSTPIPGDNNTQLQINIFDSDVDYGKYAAAIFGIDTNNGGMYLEGNPADVNNVPNFVAYEASYAKAPHYVWNLEHEYVHYLDGRFNLAGDFNAPTAPVVWWAEGVAEYVANQDDNQAAIDTINDGSTYGLSTIFATTYDGFDQDRIYRWGYLAVRFMFERHVNEVYAMRNETRAGNWTAYQARVNSWASSYSNEFTTWTQGLTNTPGGNIAPTANANGPYSAAINGNIAFSSAGSTDSDGTISSYSWNFGDGTSSTSANPSHSYSTAGTFTATLTVTDNGGKTASSNATVTVASAPTGNALQNGVAKTGLAANTGQYLRYYIDVPASATNLVIKTSGGTGDVDLYTQFAAEPTDSSYKCRPYAGGNNETCTEATPSAGRWHVALKAYSTFSGVTLTATYTTGSTNTAPTAMANGPYSANVNTNVSFSSNGSTDPDGSISSYSWTFGDGISSTSANPSHAYTSAGSYTATLTVTDNGGKTASSTAAVTINAIANEAPVVFINGPYFGDENVALNFSSAGSYDPDGSVATYNWNFGDGSTSNSANPTHAFNTAGTYNVSLNITDNQGSVTSASTTATITGIANGNPLANGVSKSVSAAQGSNTFFTMVVPADATNLSFKISGGTGDADLYVKFGAAPNANSYDCRPYAGGNNETCNISNVQAGTYHIMLTGYSAYTTSLIGSFTAGSGSNLPNACATQNPRTSGALENGVVTCLGSTNPIWFSVGNVSGHNSVAITTANGTGNINLEFSNSGWPNTSNVIGSSSNSANSECIYLTNLSQYWGYLKLSGTSTSASIVVDFDTAGCR